MQVSGTQNKCGRDLEANPRWLPYCCRGPHQPCYLIILENFDSDHPTTFQLICIHYPVRRNEIDTCISTEEIEEKWSQNYSKKQDACSGMVNWLWVRRSMNRSHQHRHCLIQGPAPTFECTFLAKYSLWYASYSWQHRMLTGPCSTTQITAGFSPWSLFSCWCSLIGCFSSHISSLIYIDKLLVCTMHGDHTA